LNTSISFLFPSFHAARLRKRAEGAIAANEEVGAFLVGTAPVAVAHGHAVDIVLVAEAVDIG
jgi:hypothetical protein